MNKLNSYNKSICALSYTPAQKAEIAAKSAQAAYMTQHKSNKKPFSHGKVAAAVVCFLSVLTITAEAAGIPTPVSQIFAPIFGGSVAQTQVIDKIGHPIDAFDSDNGITISVDAIIGDEHNACLIFSICRDDGTALLPNNITAEQLMLGGFCDIEMIRNGGSHGRSRFIDTTPGDDKIQFIHMVSADEPINKGTCTATFSDICYWDSASESAATVLEGKWKLRFEIDYEDSSITLGNGETFQQDDMAFTVSEIRLSPIALQVHYIANSEVQWTNAPSGQMPEEDRHQMQRYLENIQILLTKKDGTVINMSNSGGSITPAEGKTLCVKGAVFTEILPLEELESVSVGGIVYQVN